MNLSIGNISFQPLLCNTKSPTNMAVIPHLWMYTLAPHHCSTPPWRSNKVVLLSPSNIMCPCYHLQQNIQLYSLRSCDFIHSQFYSRFSVQIPPSKKWSWGGKTFQREVVNHLQIRPLWSHSGSASNLPPFRGSVLWLEPESIHHQSSSQRSLLLSC